MKISPRPLITSFLAVALVASTTFAEPPPPASDAGLRDKVGAAIEQGLAYLQKQQKPDGFWSAAEYPGLTALVVQAFVTAPDGKHRGDEAAKKGLAFIRKNAKADGGIYAERMGNYNTSVCLSALLRAGEPQDTAIIDAAHKFLVGAQTKNSASPASDGGFGYEAGGSGRQTRPDLDNTVFTLEALRLYRDAQRGRELPAAQDLNWQAAIDFVARCQNRGDDTPDDKGGFVYTPDGSGDRGPAGEKAAHSYGTMTYAGILSFIYADLKKDDPRIVAALDWLGKHYTLEENPGKGVEGLYYYYHLMAKGLTVGGIETLPAADGGKVNWRADLAKKLLALQKPDGSWASENGRWMEKDPNLVTTYTLLALNLIYGGL